MPNHILSSISIDQTMSDSQVSGLHDSDSDSFEHHDRLSELPDFLIFLIFSFLPMKDVVKTTVLSKRWKDVWTTTPYLNFSHPTIENLGKFRNFVSSCLSLWKGANIQKFIIDFKFFYESFKRDVDSWLHFAIENQVKELYIDVTKYLCFDTFMHNPDMEYYAPLRLYSSSSIAKLSLISCKVQIYEPVQWIQLKSLTIIGTQFEVILSEDAMNHIIAGAPQLEFLSLRTLDCRVRWNIRSTSLKTLKIERRYSIRANYVDASTVTMLKIWAPNLESLDFLGVSNGSFSLNAPSLTNVALRFHGRVEPKDRDCDDFFVDEMVRQLFLSICDVEKVWLSEWCIKVLVEMKKDMNVPLSNAKSLKFTAKSANEMLFVLEMFPKLTNLSVELLSDEALFSLFPPFPLFPSVEVPETNIIGDSLLNLRTVEISWHCSVASAIPAIQILLENAHNLEKIVFRPSRFGGQREMLHSAVDKVLCIPRSSPTAEVVVIEESFG